MSDDHKTAGRERQAERRGRQAGARNQQTDHFNELSGETELERRSEARNEGNSESRNTSRVENNSPAMLARFSLLYESRDGKLCLFEDASGHVTAVRASKLI